MSTALMTFACRRWISAIAAAASAAVAPVPAGWGCCVSPMVVSHQEITFLTRKYHELSR
jgi:hypothetical protein